MALIQKTNPVGLDLRIQHFQSYLFEKLGLADHESLPRVYLNIAETEGKKALIPELFIGKQEYNEVLFNDNHDVSSFFFRMTEKLPSIGGYGQARVAMIFQAQLDRLFPNAPHRFDEELNGMIEEASFNYNGHDIFKWETTSVGIEEVYREFNLDQISYDNMHPFYPVRFEYLVRYDPNQKC
jgi:hypothetical protein